MWQARMYKGTCIHRYKIPGTKAREEGRYNKGVTRVEGKVEVMVHGSRGEFEEQCQE
jgi:hypothetical protein